MENTALLILGRLLQKPGLASLVEEEIDFLPDAQKERIIRRLVQMPAINPAEIINGNGVIHGLISADAILSTHWPEPVWAVPGLIPAGLTILGGAAKMGKSWLSLQVCQAVAAGGVVLGRKVDQGPALYMALEDSPKRLADRMEKQKWVSGLPVHFMTVGQFGEQVGSFSTGGAEKLARTIEAMNLKIVVIDTMSRAFAVDKNEEQEITAALTPLQEISHNMNVAIILVHHHNKVNSQDTVRDLLGSTAIGAMADTIIGLYRERNKEGARLMITGRDVEEAIVNIRMDWTTGCWQPDQNRTAGLSAEEADLLDTLLDIGPASLKEVCDALDKEYDRHKGTIYKRLVELEKHHRVFKSGSRWDVYRNV